MSVWLCGKDRKATVIYGNEFLEDEKGNLLAWVNNEKVYTLRCALIGRFEDGILYDSSNLVLGTLQDFDENAGALDWSQYDMYTYFRKMKNGV